MALPFKGWKTMTFGLLVGLTYTVRALYPDAELPTQEATTQIVDLGADWITAVIGYVTMFLRAVTTTPVFRSE